MQKHKLNNELMRDKLKMMWQIIYCPFEIIFFLKRFATVIMYTERVLLRAFPVAIHVSIIFSFFSLFILLCCIFLLIPHLLNDAQLLLLLEST